MKCSFLPLSGLNELLRPKGERLSGLAKTSATQLPFYSPATSPYLKSRDPTS